MTDKQVPSISCIFRNDALAITLAVTPLALWLLFMAVDVLPQLADGQSLVLNRQMVLALVCITGFCWLAMGGRVVQVGAIFADGRVVEGQVTSIWFFRGRGQMTCEFTFEGRAYRARCNLVRSERVLGIISGQPVTLVVDAQNPRRVFVRDAFI